ncbi:BREX-2 system adenine-specific DNA-methyltransferase PglX [Streptomyces hyaluromycini]|uniref:BREX-2 system adenine-specific DNA-methyltransferase PglX n=1 Tax=Streptomyces hyaluromycini TaxID=1377993 RepID=UPI000B5CB228|nr:BREX-2 system adenine-specific DNA-methyltransferase PglX [Streptomyces hyaluromycini]
MPVDQGLTADLMRLTARVEADLAARASADPAGLRWRAEYESARTRGVTARTWSAWLDDQVSRTATAWVLVTVMIRFCEDNGLLDISLTGDAPSGDPVLQAVDRFRDHPVMGMVFGDGSSLLNGMRPGARACAELLDFWHGRTPDGTLVHDFTDAARSTSFLADLHSSLDDGARQSYGQVPTPRFVVDLVHDLTLEPALAQQASDAAGLSGFRLVDPACGSGAFLLGAYERLFRRWTELKPEMSPWQRAARALRSVHGCDIDPCAVLVARFRLLLAAMNSTQEPRIDDVPDLPLVVAAGDSLLYGSPGGPGAPILMDLGSAADVDAYADRHGLLDRASYHVVTTNPPYVTVKDKALFAAYRDAYDSCSGPYALSVPFTELAFRLARPGATAGRVGLLTSNAFMKREFGRNLVERFLPTVEISHVIDTSGAYIPGHGTPTVVLVGRSRVPDPNLPVHVVVGRRGEPGAPVEPAEGAVWRSLRRLAFEPPRATSEWAESYVQEREQLRTFPWTLTPTDAREALRRMETGKRLRDRAVRIGYAANTGSDDIFCATADTFRRSGAEESATVPVLTGSEVRDWSADPALVAFFPRTGRDGTPVDLRGLPGHHRRLWPYRTVLRERPGTKKKAPWYDWHQISAGWDTHPWSIVFPWVATHPHFTLLRGSAVPLNSAPEIKLSPSESEDSHLGLLGALNSSAVCFWLKQMSQSKGQPRAGQLRGGEAWEKIYEFTSTRLLDLPLPEAFPHAQAAELDRLAVESRHVLTDVADPATHLDDRFLSRARERWQTLRSRMVAAQEELDWQVYALYGLVAEEGLTAQGDLPSVALGERAFEIALARRVATGEEQTDWFTRHTTTPVTDIPRHWPSAYRDLVERRVYAIQQSPVMALLEQPEYKRRWAAPPWEVLIHGILKERLLDRCESSRLWYEHTVQGRRPVTLTVRKLAELLGKDEDFTSVAALYSRSYTPGAVNVSEVLLELLADEHVPQAAPLRYKASGLDKRRQWEELWKAQRWDDSQGHIDSEVPHPVPPRFTSADFLRPSYWRRRGKYDMPSERFVSFASSASPLSLTTTIGWAGWSADERALAVLDLLDAGSHAHTHRPASALPLLRALVDQLPRITAPGDEPAADAEAREELLHRRYAEHLTRLGLSAEEVMSWRPAAPKRGRPRKGA